jgi:phage gp46-like protein
MAQITISSEAIDLYDLSLSEVDGDHLETSDSLYTPVLISLLTERRAADANEVPGRSLGGWWGDSYPDTPGYMLGSRLWTLHGEPFGAESMVRAETYVREALQWMVDTGVVPSQDHLHVRLEWDAASSRLAGVVSCRRPGTASTAWEVAWSATLA